MAKVTLEHSRMRPMQKRAIDLFKQNILSGGTKSYKEILREAGYDEESVRQYTNVMEGIKPHIQPFIEKMETHREKVMERLIATVDTAQYSDLVRSLDVLSHNIQLLGGKPTQNIAISAEVRARIDGLVEQ